MKIDIGKLTDIRAEGSIYSKNIIGITLFMDFEKENTYIDINRKQAKKLVNKLQKLLNYNRQEN